MAAKNFTLKPNDEGNKTHMFVGEQILARADVKRFNSISGRDYGVSGELVVTNFKISFEHSLEKIRAMSGKKQDSVATLDKILLEERCYLNDIIPLTSIYKIYAISSTKQKRKKVKNAEKEISSHYDIIEIEMKDFRIINYDLKDSSNTDRRSCFKTISHHAFPSSATQLFGFDYGENMRKSSIEDGRAFCMFTHNKDYEMILSRLQSSEQWRVSNINNEFGICRCLPEYIVCPAVLEEEDLKSISDCYVDKKFPTWLWNDPNTGAALLISSRLNDIPSHPQKMLDCISMCHFAVQSVSDRTTTYDICSSPCPTLKELKVSFDNLHKICIVHSSKEFWADSTWFSEIENTKWLQYVLKCLRAAETVAKTIKDDSKSVIVNDDNGCDLSILIASIVQILLDPYYRTHVGFQALIQKDWVMGGHPFSKRLKNICDVSGKLDEKNEASDGECPVFLLFLDCVHQLVYQNPMKFEYTEQFLILIADCTYTSLFHTFMFNCDAEYQSSRGDSNLVSVWDFISAHIPLFKFSLMNPAYNIEDVKLSSHSSMLNSDELSGIETIDSELIIPICKHTNIKLWSNYFCRWFPSTSVSKGFTTNVILQLQQKRLVEEIMYLQDRMQQMQQKSGVCDNDSAKNSLGSLGRQKKGHKRENSKHDSNEEDYGYFFCLMSDFYFLKIL